MRRIDPSDYSPPEEWLARAKAKANAVSTLSAADRSKEISKHPLWTELKSHLAGLSQQKCWYCESRQIRSDMHVDHFRPKNAVSKDDCVDHPGYWWLAYDWHNYRYSCSYCNSPHRDGETGTTAGKGSRFPVAIEAKHAKAPSDSVDDEQPVLLDPLVLADVSLLWFNEDGQAVPRHSGPGWLCQRAAVSIEVFFLNQADLREARAARVGELRRAIAIAEGAYKDYAAGGSAVARERFERSVEEVAGFFLARAEYSAAARSYARGVQDEHPWLGDILAQL